MPVNQASATNRRPVSVSLATGQSRVLELIATGAPLAETLSTLTGVIEARAGGMLASILLLSTDGKRLQFGAAPSLPDEYNQLTDGLEIGPNVGSCGTAAFLDRPVIVTDIATDPRWVTARDVALKFDLRACWSTPIHSSRGDVLGTFALYYREPRAPTAWHRKLIGVATHLASIAIERERDEAERSRVLKQERAARERAEHLTAEITAIVSQVAEGIIVADAKGRITFVNEAAKRIPGIAECAAGECPNGCEMYTPAGELYPLVERPILRAAQRGETIIDAEWHLRQADGTEIVAQGSVAPVVSEQHRRVGAVMAVRDVTEQRAIQGERDAFLAAASHDLKGPLTVIKGTAALLERRAKQSPQLSSDEIAPNLTRIVSSANTMLKLIDELLDLGRLRLGRPLELERVSTDLVALVHELAGEYQMSTERHAIKVRAPSTPLVGSWDRARLARVFDNLLSNAVKFSPKGGEIQIDVDCEPGRDQPLGVVRVHDQGVGIPTTEITRIFERYHRAGNIVGWTKGSGLGLASAKYIVEQHGGTIRAESVEGVGTTIIVRLPLQEAPAR